MVEMNVNSNSSLSVLVVIIAFLCSFSHIVSANDWIYTIKAGDTIWDINEELLVDENNVLLLLKKNGISNPRRLQPGTKIAIPIEIVKKHISNGVVTKVNGKVFISNGTSDAILPLKIGMILSAGDRLTTEDKSYVLIVFSDKSSLIIQENSKVTFVAIEFLGKQSDPKINLEINLQQGEVEMEANPTKADDARYRIKTPIASTAVKGTKFYVQSTSKASHMGVLTGSVSVKNNFGEIVLAPGTGTKAEKGKAPIPPVSLLLQPMIKIPASISYLPHTINIPSQEGASKYRIEISNSADFIRTFMDDIIENKFSFPNTLPSGEYFVRIRGINRVGIQGKPFLKRINIDLLPEKPVLTSPPEDMQHVGEITFSWYEAKEAGNYLFELSRTSEFSDPVYISKNISKRELSLNLLEPGDYFFRVSGFSDKDKQGKVSETHTLHLLSPLKTMKIVSQDSSTNNLTVRWQALDGADYYRVQLSATSDFKSISTFQEIKSTAWKYQRVRNDDYYVRICGVDKLNTLGPCISTKLPAQVPPKRVIAHHELNQY